ncbi:hypothetical protein CVV68_22785 [Arthrobacter livingstonensis]|uniref:Alpha/beta hydrolase n=1 Tax=Arthrobacter livingstonensis TaxID=670078 RepID=A0A2V5KZB9_9MICC|nr:hypothetical protein [Arthrobacter livingstonensis]PYI64018.1 hypothetical protein CVV68_22785 [Arthrobacter livingstonensis]
MVVVGHSFGDLVAQKLLGDNLASAAVAIDSAAMKGVNKVTLTVWRSSFPVISRASNKAKAVSLTENQFRYGFGNEIPKAESKVLFEQFSIPVPALLRGLGTIARESSDKAHTRASGAV